MKSYQGVKSTNWVNINEYTGDSEEEEGEFFPYVVQIDTIIPKEEETDFKAVSTSSKKGDSSIKKQSKNPKKTNWDVEDFWERVMKKEEKMTEGKKFDFYPHSPIIIDENSDDSIEILYQSTKTSHSIDEFQTFNNEFDKKNKKKSIVMIDRTQNVTEEDFEKEKVHKSTQTYFFDYINFRSNSRIQSPKKLNQTSISLDKDISPDRYRSCRVPKLSFRKSENLNIISRTRRYLKFI
eukprot:gene1430-12049_t